MTQRIDDEVLNALLAYQQWKDGEDILLVTGSTVIAASQADQTLLTFQPPVDTFEEWIPMLINVREANGIDNADSNHIGYIDQITNQVLWFTNGLANAIAGLGGNFFIWPKAVSAVTINSQPQLQLRTYRRNSKEPWRAVVVRVTTTATVGNRSYSVSVLYKRRQL